MADFRFKQFSVKQDASALKLGTDAVLLGAAMTLRESDKAMLDVGTGTGVIALMVAQRLASQTFDGGSPPITSLPTLRFFDGGSPPITSYPTSRSSDGGSPPITSPQAPLTTGVAAPISRTANIVAIDIDGPSAAEAAANFAASPWPGMLSARHCALRDFVPAAPLDLIFSNPPYYDESLKNPDAREAAARHTESLSCREIFAFGAQWLAPEGRLSLILPADQETAAVRSASSFGLYPFRIIWIKTTERKPVRRLILELGRERKMVSEESLTIQKGGSRSEEYAALTREFYL